MRNSNFRYLNNFLSGILVLFIFVPGGFLHAQTNESLRIDPDTGLVIPRAQVVNPAAATAQSGGISLDAAGPAVSGCVSQLIGSVIGQNLNSAINSLTSSIGTVPVLDVKQATKETGGLGTPSLDGVAFCLGNAVIESILAGTIQWVQSGFNGNPVFIDDPEQFFTDVADYELGLFLDEVSNGYLCSPWDVNIRLSVLDGYYGNGDQYRGCRLTDVINNIDGFLEGNFEEGGWTGWYELTQKPLNNPYGSYRVLNDGLYSRIATRRGIVDAELGWSGGFLSLKNESGKTTTPGLLIQQSVSNKLNIPAERLTFADEFDELISALVNQFVTIAFEEFQ